MIAKFVKAIATLLLVIGVGLAFYSAAWRQASTTAGNKASTACSVPGAKSSGASEAGKPATSQVCKTVEKAGGGPAFTCADAQSGIATSGSHSLAFGAKGGGAGAIAISTLLVLVGLWCLVAAWKSRQTTSA